MPRPTYTTLTSTILPSAQRTANANSDPLNIAVNHDVFGMDAHTGYLEKGLIFVDQTAGSGNSGGQYFNITVETAMVPAGPWLNVPLSNTIHITANGAATYGATFAGPLAGYVRVKATAVNSPDATFSASIIVGG